MGVPLLEEEAYSAFCDQITSSPFHHIPPGPIPAEKSPNGSSRRCFHGTTHSRVFHDLAVHSVNNRQCFLPTCPVLSIRYGFLPCLHVREYFVLEDRQVRGWTSGVMGRLGLPGLCGCAWLSQSSPPGSDSAAVARKTREGRHRGDAEQRGCGGAAHFG